MKVEVWTATIENPDNKQPLTLAAECQKGLGELLRENYTDETDVDAPPAWHSSTLGISPLVVYLEETQGLTIHWDSHPIEVDLPLVDPTTHVEAVGRKLWGHFRPANRGDLTWEDLNAVDKQEFKQNIVGVLYATLEALVEQGVIGGISRG